MTEKNPLGLERAVARVPYRNSSDERLIGFVVPVSSKWALGMVTEQLAEIIEGPSTGDDVSAKFKRGS